MKAVIAKRHSASPAVTGLNRVLPEIQALIEASRQHVVTTANLTLVWLYWNVGRVITEDIQENRKRANYGQQLIEQLSVRLARDYGRGFSAPNLWTSVAGKFVSFSACLIAAWTSSSDFKPA